MRRAGAGGGHGEGDGGAGAGAEGSGASGGHGTGEGGGGRSGGEGEGSGDGTAGANSGGMGDDGERSGGMLADDEGQTTATGDRDGEGEAEAGSDGKGEADGDTAALCKRQNRCDTSTVVYSRLDNYNEAMREHNDAESEEINLSTQISDAYQKQQRVVDLMRQIRGRSKALDKQYEQWTQAAIRLERLHTVNARRRRAAKSNLMTRAENLYKMRTKYPRDPV
ncbi:MAG: hypothetical protein Q9227_003179 [Pyrenula ochraceoflavens]